MLHLYTRPLLRQIKARLQEHCECVRTVRHRTRQTKGSLSCNKTRIMVFKLIKAAEKNGLRLRARHQSPKLITGVKLVDADEFVLSEQSEFRTLTPVVDHGAVKPG